MKPNLGLRDIQGLDSISVWPLAVGWWILMGLTVIGLGIFFALRARRRRAFRSWQRSVSEELGFLERTLNAANSQMTAVRLSTLLRQLALHRYARSECAGLEGEAWLKWLSENDGAQFDWAKTGRCLIEAPFGKPGLVIDPVSLKAALRATKEWVK